MDWNSELNLIAYAAHKMIIIYDPKTMSLKTLIGNCDKITCLKFMGSHAIISGSMDGSISIWILNASNEWELTQTLNGHSSGVITLATLNDWFVSSASDGSIRIWNKVSSLFECTQVIELGTKYALALALGYLPGTNCM